jgi:phosphate uptake regulator
MREMLRLPCGIDRLERVADEALRAAERARDVEPPVEATEVLGGLERLLERRLRQAQRRCEPFELARVDVGHRRIIAPDPYAR